MGADTELLAACDRFHDVDALLQRWDREEVDLADFGASAVTAWWECCDAIAAIHTTSEVGRWAKLRCAVAAMRGVDEASPRRFALLRSAICDVVSAWEAQL